MLFDTKGHCFERDIIMLNVRWYLSYKLSYRDLGEMATERRPYHDLPLGHKVYPRGGKGCAPA